MYTHITKAIRGHSRNLRTNKSTAVCSKILRETETEKKKESIICKNCGNEITTVEYQHCRERPTRTYIYKSSWYNIPYRLLFEGMGMFRLRHPHIRGYVVSRIHLVHRCVCKLLHPPGLVLPVRQGKFLRFDYGQPGEDAVTRSEMKAPTSIHY